MPIVARDIGTRRLIDRAGLDRLCAELLRRGYRLIGPRARDGAIVYAELGGVRDLPEGVANEQAAGRYRLTRRSDKALFGCAVGPHSWKQFLFPPGIRLLAASREGRSWTFRAETPPRTKYAFLGVRACELAAIAVQDKVFLSGDYADPIYSALRQDAFLIAVQCTQSGANCFCASMGTGPRAARGFDLALTEFADASGSDFLAEVGTERGAELLASSPGIPATAERAREAEAASERCRRTQSKSMPEEGLREFLQGHPEHSRWDDIAARCLSCANCTMVCPTCFCSAVEDSGDLRGDRAERRRRWDSCFTNDFSYIHGGSVRSSTRAKYRQWMTHKLASWRDQFETPGCVGCGRCIAWCPAGIDITEEVRAMREAPNERKRA